MLLVVSKITNKNERRWRAFRRSIELREAFVTQANVGNFTLGRFENCNPVLCHEHASCRFSLPQKIESWSIDERGSPPADIMLATSVKNTCRHKETKCFDQLRETNTKSLVVGFFRRESRSRTPISLMTGPTKIRLTHSGDELRRWKSCFGFPSVLKWK